MPSDIRLKLSWVSHHLMRKFKALSRAASLILVNGGPLLALIVSEQLYQLSQIAILKTYYALDATQAAGPGAPVWRGTVLEVRRFVMSPGLSRTKPPRLSDSNVYTVRICTPSIISGLCHLNRDADRTGGKTGSSMTNSSNMSCDVQLHGRNTSVGGTVTAFTGLPSKRQAESGRRDAYSINRG